MKIFNTAVFLCVVVFVVEAREKHECEVKLGVTDADWEEMKKDELNLSDKLACFVKCALEKDGSLDSEGKLVMEKFHLGLNKMFKLSEKAKSEVNTCLKTAAPVKTCSDVRPIHLCVAKNRRL